jgi:hypothetical protein
VSVRVAPIFVLPPLRPSQRPVSCAAHSKCLLSTTSPIAVYEFGNSAKIAGECEAVVTHKKSKSRDTAELSTPCHLMPLSSRRRSANGIDFIAYLYLDMGSETHVGGGNLSSGETWMPLEIQLFISCISAFLKVLRRVCCGRLIEAYTARYRRRIGMQSHRRRKFNLKNGTV